MALALGLKHSLKAALTGAFWDAADAVAAIVRGLVIEPASTNYWLYSADFQAGVTSGLFGSGGVTMTGAQAFGQSTYGWRMQSTGGTTRLFGTWNTSATTDYVRHCYSIYWKAGTAGATSYFAHYANDAVTIFQVLITPDGSGAPVLSGIGGTNPVTGFYAAPEAGAGWYRIWCSVDVRVGDGGRCEISPSQSGTSGQYAYFALPQCERGDYPTTPIPTGNTTASRAADNLYKNGLTAHVAGDSMSYGIDAMSLALSTKVGGPAYMNYAGVVAFGEDSYTGNLSEMRFNNGTNDGILAMRGAGGVGTGTGNEYSAWITRGRDWIVGAISGANGVGYINRLKNLPAQPIGANTLTGMVRLGTGASIYEGTPAPLIVYRMALWRSFIGDAAATAADPTVAVTPSTLVDVTSGSIGAATFARASGAIGEGYTLVAANAPRFVNAGVRL